MGAIVVPDRELHPFNCFCFRTAPLDANSVDFVCFLPGRSR